ncbi:hypothetical protein [Methanosphaera sp. WGK6]|uniref:hypothetical protein n=1 Tax=Methanosphaera sp. WGK6 TaxID=1561964 RepID=UPI00084C4176|nr:hypothetical protein [Methanosphaera sp. WGK6]OED29924.1 hypothetical protein NL43_05820 [Methanosphaera sp. WGK6]
MIQQENMEEFWNPEEESEIQGIVVDKLENIGKYKSKLYKIQDKTIIYNIWGKTQLDRLMETVMIGDKIQITYNGLIKTKKFKMKKYTVKIINDDEE